MYHAMLQIRRFLPSVWPCSLPSLPSLLPFHHHTKTAEALCVPFRQSLAASLPRAHGAPSPPLSSSLHQPLFAASRSGRLRRGSILSAAGSPSMPALASRFQSSPERHRGGGDMTMLRVVGKTASSHSKSPAATHLPDDPEGAGTVTVVAEGPDHHNSASVNGSKDETFFEARPWLDSDSEDDFYSMRGDFTPSRGGTPDHPRLTSSSGWMLVDRSGPSLVRKKQRLLELLQEKQHYDDEDDDSVTDVSSDLENSAVHAEEHMRTSRRSEKAKKSSRAGCLSTLIWKHSFTSRRKKNKEKEQQDKAN